MDYLIKDFILLKFHYMCFWGFFLFILLITDIFVLCLFFSKEWRGTGVGGIKLLIMFKLNVL